MRRPRKPDTDAAAADERTVRTAALALLAGRDFGRAELARRLERRGYPAAVVAAVVDGLVEVAEKPRTRARARARVAELLTASPIEQIAFLHTQAPDLDAFRDDVLAHLRAAHEAVEALVALLAGSQQGIVNCVVG